jgi:hypothetical protein
MEILSKEKARLIKEALKIVDKLAESDLVEADYPFMVDGFDYDKLVKLINKARELKNNSLWVLK